MRSPRISTPTTCLRPRLRPCDGGPLSHSPSPIGIARASRTQQKIRKVLLSSIECSYSTDVRSRCRVKLSVKWPFSGSGRRIASRPALTVALRAFEFADELAPPCTSRVSTACQTDSVDVHTCTALLDSRCNQDRHGPTGRRPQRRIRERGDALSSHGVVGSPAPLSSAEQWPSSLLFFNRSRTRGPSGEPVW